jgi:hypothetical protein
VKSPETFHGHDLALAYGSRCREDRVVPFLEFASLGIPQLQVRTAGGAGIWLRVKPPIRRCFIFGAALAAQSELTHGGVPAVIGEALDNAEPGAAVGAVGEGIEIPSVAWIQHFRKTLGTGSNVRLHHGAFWPERVAVQDSETSSVVGQRQPSGLETLNVAALGFVFR